MTFYKNAKALEMERLQTELDAKTERFNTLEQSPRDLTTDEERELFCLQDEIQTLNTLLDITYFGE